MSDILDWQQGTSSAVIPDGFERVTNPLLPAARTQDRLQHFTDGVYDLRPESHLSKLLKVLLGEAGVGYFRKRMMLTRLQSLAGGNHFFDLDTFWGALLGVPRQSLEIQDFSPSTEVATNDDWKVAHIKDASYRSRVSKFAEALAAGATPSGIEAVAEAILGSDVDVVEQVTNTERWRRKWGDIEAIGQWQYVENQGAWRDVEWRDLTDINVTGGATVHQVVNVYPRREITWEERYALTRALNQIRPAGTIVRVHQTSESAYVDVPVQAAKADSEYWELVAYDRNDSTALNPGVPAGEFAPRRRYAWSSHQGEAWSYISLNVKVIAYTINGPVSNTSRFDPLIEEVPPQVVTINGVITPFIPGYALKSIDRIMSGRLVSDGILTANPYGDSTDDIRADGVPIDEVVPYRRPMFNRFWVSPIRARETLAYEALEIRLPQPALVNSVSFSFSRFPGTFVLQMWDDERGAWIDLVSRSYSRANPYGINGSIPDGEIHPFHRGSTHWEKFASSIDSVEGSVFRILMKRDSGFGPVGVDGKHIPYSLALKDVDLGYRITSEGQLPNIDNLLPVTSMGSAAGLTTQYLLERYAAALALDTTMTAWKSEPQPISDAVVNFYLDVRDENGGGVALDRIWIDPLTPGAMMNLYWSNDEPDDIDSFTSAEDVMSPAVEGNVVGNGVGLTWGATPARFVFSNSDLRLDTRASWWSAFEMIPSFSSGDGTRTCILSSGGADDDGLASMSLWWENDAFRFTVGTRTIRLTLTDGVVKGQRLRLYLNYTVADGPAISFSTPAALDILDTQDESISTDDGVFDVVHGWEVMPDGAVIDTTGLVIDGSGDGLVTNYTFPEDTGPFSFVWTGTLSDYQPGTIQTLWSIDGGSGEHVMKMEINGTGHLSLSLSETGSTYTTAASPNVPSVANSDRATFRIDWDIDGGTNFFLLASDGSWTSLGAEQSISIAGVYTGATADMMVGGLFGSPSMSIAGSVQRVMMRRGFSGAKLFDANFVRPTSMPTTIVIGNRFATTPITLTAAVLGFGSRTASDVLADIIEYARRPKIGTGKTDGTVLRYHGSYYDRATRRGLGHGWMGGVGDFWWAIHWNPLAHNVPVTKGSIDVPQTRAKFLKMEFTSLLPEPYEAFLETNRLVRRMALASDRGQGARSLTTLDQAVMNLAAQGRFTDTPAVTANPWYDTASPTSAIVPTDPIGNERIGEAGYGFRLAKWQPNTVIPMNSKAGLHTYEQVWLRHSSKMAFFVGLKTVRVQRFDPAIISNARVYYDSFVDDYSLESLTWGLEPGMLYTPEHGSNTVLPQSLVATSKTFVSRSPIHAVQIATTQSSSFQLVPDDEFRSPALSYIDFTDPDGWTATGDAFLKWDRQNSMMTVSRDPATVLSVYAPDTPLVRRIVAPIFGPVTKETVTVSTTSYGGIVSPLLLPSPEGVIHVAARASTDEKLSAPLKLVVIGSDDTTILASVEFTPQAHDQLEVVLPYQMGSHPSLEATLRVAVIQDGGSKDKWSMQALSVFDDAVLWEVSNDGGKTWVPVLTGRNSPTGAVRFLRSGNALKWRVTGYKFNTVIGSVQIRPWYDLKVGAS